MEPPDRLIVPTCVGCGAMSRFGTCASTCSEHQLELVRAVLEKEQRLRGLVQRIAWVTPRGGEWEQSWRALKAEAAQSAHSTRGPGAQADTVQVVQA